MNLNLDLIVGWGCVIIALGVFFLHSVTSPRDPKSWLPTPDYLRHGLAVFGAAIFLRGEDCFTLAHQPGGDPGHINWWGLGPTASLIYLALAGIYFAVSRHMSRARMTAAINAVLTADELRPAKPRRHPTVT